MTLSSSKYTPDSKHCYGVSGSRQVNGSVVSLFSALFLPKARQKWRVSIPIGETKLRRPTREQRQRERGERKGLNSRASIWWSTPRACRRRTERPLHTRREKRGHKKFHFVTSKFKVGAVLTRPDTRETKMQPVQLRLGLDLAEIKVWGPELGSQSLCGWSLFYAGGGEMQSLSSPWNYTIYKTTKNVILWNMTIWCR